MENSQSKKNYIYIVLAVVFLIAAIVWAYYTGRRDGAQHNKNSANQTVNKTQ